MGLERSIYTSLVFDVRRSMVPFPATNYVTFMQLKGLSFSETVRLISS